MNQIQSINVLNCCKVNKNKQSQNLTCSTTVNKTKLLGKANNKHSFQVMALISETL